MVEDAGSFTDINEIESNTKAVEHEMKMIDGNTIFTKWNTSLTSFYAIAILCARFLNFFHSKYYPARIEEVEKRLERVETRIKDLVEDHTKKFFEYVAGDLDELKTEKIKVHPEEYDKYHARLRHASFKRASENTVSETTEETSSI